MIVDCVTEWLLTYPGLAGGRLHVDFLPLPARSFTVDAVPCQPVVRQYLSGAYKQFQFILASREFLASDVRTGTYNLNFYEDFERWVEKSNREKVLPMLGDGCAAHKVVVNSSGYPYLVDEHGTARYQIQMTLFYHEL